MSVNLKEVSACLITKDPWYPSVILDQVQAAGFGEILILCNSDSQHRKHDLFAKAKHDWLYAQDDDALCPIRELAEQAEPGLITLAMKQGHFDSYAKVRMTQGIGWGAFFQKDLLKRLDLYRAKYGEDFLYKRDSDKIWTSLCYPQKRLVLHIEDLPSATAPDRLWREPNHYDYGAECERRCTELLSAEDK